MAKKKCFVIGYPLSHTLSPAMHNANFRKLGIDCVYVARELGKEKLAGFLEELRQEDVAGTNVTIPYKEEVMKCLDEVDETAKKIGAVNTIVNRKGKLIGYNTDWVGATRAIEEKVKIKGKRCIVLGAGGAARAVCFALAKGGAKKVTIANRTKGKAVLLAEEFGGKVDAQFEGIDLQEIGKVVRDAALIINCTSIGMKEGECPVRENVLHKGMAVFDLVYNPKETKLILEAKKKGCKTITGERMLLFQGAESFKLWFGREADLKAMQEALERELDRRKNIVRIGMRGSGKMDIGKRKKNIAQMGMAESRKASAGKLEKNIVLIGMMGSGKTSVGKFLAKKMKRKFIDMDKEIEKKAGRCISEIFKKRGERFFREIESIVAVEAALMQNTVISCGGGVVLKEGNMNELKRNGIVFYLKADTETLANRVGWGRGRPLLEGREKKERLEEILGERERLYEKYADETARVRKEKEKVAEEILKKLRIGR